MSKAQSVRYSDWDAAIEKLTAMTESGEVVWEVRDDFRGGGEDSAITPAFYAEVNGRDVLVYEYNYKHFTDADEWEWHSDIAIEFVTPSAGLEYPWQGSRVARRRLIDAIRYRAAHVDDFLKEFLQK
jgi:hypothetical protein